MDKSSNYAPALGRLLMAALFLFSGIGKLMDPAGTIGYIASVGAPFPNLAFALAAAIEVGGGLLLVIGYRARLVAAVMAAFTLATALLFHTRFGDTNQLIHFLKNVAIAGGLLQVVGFGAGAWSVDARGTRAR